MQREDLEKDSLMPWEDVPLACGFRVPFPRLSGVKRRATAKDQKAQRQRYAKCKVWASQCGLLESEFQSILDRVSSSRDRRKGAGLSQGRGGYRARRRKGASRYNGCDSGTRVRSDRLNAWEHAKRECIDIAIRRAAADAGGLLGGEHTAEQAAEEVSELMSSEAVRFSRWGCLSKRWRSMMGLRLTEDSCKTLGNTLGHVCLHLVSMCLSHIVIKRFTGACVRASTISQSPRTNMSQCKGVGHNCRVFSKGLYLVFPC